MTLGGAEKSLREIKHCGNTIKYRIKKCEYIGRMKFENLLKNRFYCFYWSPQCRSGGGNNG